MGIEKTEEIQRHSNIKKYGDASEDIINLQYGIGIPCWVGFCMGNVQKYLKRYMSNSHKAANIADIAKVLDYINRLKEHVNPNVFSSLIESISEKNFKTAYAKAIEIQRALVRPSWSIDI